MTRCDLLLFTVVFAVCIEASFFFMTNHRLRIHKNGEKTLKKNCSEQLESLKNLAPSVDSAKLSQLLSCCHALVSPEAVDLGLPDFPLENLSNGALILEKFPSLPALDVFYRFYPYKLFLGKEGRDAVESVLKTFAILEAPQNRREFSGKILGIDKNENSSTATLHRDGEQSTFDIPSGSGAHSDVENLEYVETNYQNSLISDLMISHSAMDFCIIGPKGCGKSTVVKKLANLLEYEIEPIVLYQDMTSRDLIQQRTTLPTGDTVWKDSPLVVAAVSGKMAILDGIHRLHTSTLAIINRLVQDRELQLHDGKRIMRHDRYDEIKAEGNKSDEEMKNSGLLRMHPSFRLVAIAEPPVMNSSSGQWLNSEILSLFNFHAMRPLDRAEELHIIRSKYGEPSRAVTKIIDLAHNLRSSSDPTLQSLAGFFSTRQLLRIAARMNKFPNDDVYEAVQRACLGRFLPALPRQALEETLKRLDVQVASSKRTKEEKINCLIDEESVTIGNTKIERYKTRAMTKVPDILFYDVPQHLALLEILMQDFVLGQNILLVGNQGVGKNKIVDRLLQLMNRPREYIQLHRDTTVQTLTLQPMIRDGVVVYEDSPLVAAVRQGHVLVIDEADKAPTHVTCVLKTLAENGEMILSDGRRIIPAGRENQNDSMIPIHPDFRMIVLANRPGFPFLGNDFFGALGDLFSTHSVDNPDFNNEIELLKQYGPNVDENIVQKLVKAFGELRSMADQGLVSYPYSTREVVNIVKHLQKFPDEPLAKVVQNVFDFDRYSPEIFETLVTVLHKYGIPIGTTSKNVTLAKEFRLPKVTLAETWNVSSRGKALPVQEKFIKLSSPSYPSRSNRIMDKVEARSSWFTELQNYWYIPLGEASSIGAVAVSKGLKGDATDDRIHVLATNPTSIFSMTSQSEEIQEISINGHFNPMRGIYPKYTMATDKSDNLLVHEGTSNGSLLINLESGSVQSIQTSSLLSSASEKWSQTFGNRSTFWRMSGDLLRSDNLVIFYTYNEDRIEATNMETLTSYSMTLPCKIESLLVPSSDKWLIQDTSKNLYVLQKSGENDPCPNILKEIARVSVNKSPNIGRLTGSSNSNMDDALLGKALNEQISSPNRILASDSTYASLAIGFPELEGSNEIYTWPRNERVSASNPPLITEQGQVIRTLPSNKVPEEVIPGDPKSQRFSGFLEIVDPVNQTNRYLAIPEPTNVPVASHWMYTKELPVHVATTSNNGLVTVDAGGCLRMWETSPASIHQSLKAWRKMVGDDGQYLQVTKERDSGLDVSSPKHGKVDEKNEPHVGGNTWAGGTGGRDTAGLGGKGGPYRLDAGHTVHQLSDEEKNLVPEHVRKAAREMGQRAFKQRLKDIRMSEYDHNVYSQFRDAVAKQIQSLRVILDSLQAKSKERQWLKHQTSGELDDTKLIEGLTGEKTIYRRRAEKEPELGAAQLKPKRLKLVVDVSGSMYRFNGYDGRLDREMEACVMVMEAFAGYEAKFRYDIVGHSGDDCHIPFVDHAQPPADNKQRLQVIKTMHAHSQYCTSGDNTLEATQRAITSLAKEDSDESIVVVLSDANLERYGIPPSNFAKVLTSNANVNAYAIFIGSLGDQANRLIKKMPAGRAFVCMDLKDIPRILQQIFTASVLNTRSN
ncbi:von Willebrand factor A domain-containing protein 8 isoform X2 [Venturia canescens]|uniref:von Willebrand factor A domain-containing protein 8 isoform X2 n=1 Tax=Venturia canescens TaxID=32260 RepID=UPI001C9D5999|nr:von Willebrand factor A domain-containing protein 8 isoform X2 [Venturia canescens]